MTQTLNGIPRSTTQRKTLAHQLDRLDSIIDALDVGLSGAITAAVQEAVSTAVAETVRATLGELVTNPDVLILLRNLLPTPPVVTLPEPQPETPARVYSQPRRGISAAWDWTLSKVQAGVGATQARVRSIRNALVGGFRKVNSIWSLKRPLLIAASVGLGCGVVGYYAAPELAGVLIGVSAMLATLGAHLAIWVKRLLPSFPST